MRDRAERQNKVDFKRFPCLLLVILALFAVLGVFCSGGRFSQEAVLRGSGIEIIKREREGSLVEINVNRHGTEIAHFSVRVKVCGMASYTDINILV